MDGQDGRAAAERGGLLSRLAQWLRGPGELGRLQLDELDGIARDLGMTSGELKTLASCDPRAADLLHERLNTLGLQPADIDRLAFGLMRDLERDCSCCGSKEECAHDLTHQPQSPGWMAYCANAATIEAARRAKGRAPI